VIIWGRRLENNVRTISSGNKNEKWRCDVIKKMAKINGLVASTIMEKVSSSVTGKTKKCPFSRLHNWFRIPQWAGGRYYSQTSKCWKADLLIVVGVEALSRTSIIT